MSNKTISILLNIFGWVFFVAGILVFCAAIILLATELYFDDPIFIAMIAGSLFASSWGALLFGIKRIAEK